MSVVFVGSKNEVKLRGVGRGLDQRPDLSFWSRDRIVAAPAESGVKSQPTSLEEILEGATNRARWCHAHRLELLVGTPLLHEGDGLDLFVGIESGLVRVGSSILDLCVAHLEVHHDDLPGGHREVNGFSSAFELPTNVLSELTDERMSQGYDLDDACRDAGLTTSAQIGRGIGLVGILSGGLLSREDYTFEAFRNALFMIAATASRRPLTPPVTIN